MIELAIIVGMLFAFVTGALIMFAALYPQLRLFKGMLTDRHVGELRKEGQKTSVVAPMDVVTEKSDVSTGKAHVEIKPPNLFDRRTEIENRERKNQERINQEFAGSGLAGTIKGLG